MTVTETLRSHLAERQETLYQVAKESGVSWSSLYKFQNGGGLRGEQFDKLCDYFGATLTIPKKPKGK